jgi:flagellar basal-body rod modification protein FlgD
MAGTDMFLQLLVAQMKNQDPSQPMDNSTFVTQLAQFNTVEQMITLNQSITSEIAAQQTAEAVSMIGKTITYQIPGTGGAPPSVGQDVVTGVTMQGTQVSLQGATSTVPLSEVTAVTG